MTRTPAVREAVAREHHLFVPPGTPLVPGKLYLRLLHGRTVPAEEMAGWGFDGPTFGPLAGCGETDRSTLRVVGTTGDEVRLFRTADLIRRDGCFYGGWELFLADPDASA